MNNANEMFQKHKAHIDALSNGDAFNMVEFINSTKELEEKMESLQTAFQKVSKSMY